MTNITEHLASTNSCFDAIDLFSGCGGMSLGFQNVGFNIIAAFDNWEPAVRVYKKNFKHPMRARTGGAVEEHGGEH